MKTGKLIAALAVILTASATLFFLWRTPSLPALSGELKLAVVGQALVKIEDADFTSRFYQLASKAKPVLIGRYETPVAEFTAGGTAFTVMTDSRGNYAIASARQKYKIDKGEYGKLAIHDGLRPVVLANTPLPILVTLSDSSILLPPCESSWQYRSIDGIFHDYTADLLCPQTQLANGLSATALSFSAPPQTVKLSVSRDGTAVYQSETADGLKFTLTVYGDYLYQTEASWNTDLFRGSCRYNITVAYKKVITFDISASSTLPGEFLVLRVGGAEASDQVNAKTDLNFTPTFFPLDGGMSALMPIDYSLSPGNYSITINAGGKSQRFTLTIDKKSFVIQRMTVSESTADSTINSQKANAEFTQKVTRLKSVSDPEVYFSGKFIMPVQGEITTEFGSIRYINNGPTPTRHGGIDIAADLGTKVLASGRGRVLFSEYIALTGNTILLEHGLGLKTSYYHMDKLAVKAGEMVEKGQVIGYVGSTGFSTGPHLHFAAMVGSVYINPWTLMDEETIFGRP